MWYFTWILGVGFAVLLAILNTLWGEHEDGRLASRQSAPGAEADSLQDAGGQRTTDRS